MQDCPACKTTLDVHTDGRIIECAIRIQKQRPNADYCRFLAGVEELDPILATRLRNDDLAPLEPAPLFAPYRRFECEPRDGNLLDAPLSVIARLVKDITAVEQPVHVDTVVDRVRTTYGLAKAGNRI